MMENYKQHNDYGSYGYPDTGWARDQEAISPVKLVLKAFFKRPLIVALTFILIAGPAILYIYLMVPVYQSQATIYVPPAPRGGGSSMPSMDMLASYGESDEFYMSILNSSTYREQLVLALKEKHPYLSIDSLKRVVKNGLSASKRPRTTGFINLTARSESPELAKSIADKSLEVMFQSVGDMKREDARFIAEYVDKLLFELNEKLEDIDLQIQAFMRDRGLREEDLLGGESSEIRHLERKLGEAEARRDMARLQIDSFTNLIQDRLDQYLSTEPQISGDSRLGSLRTQLNKLSEQIKDSLDFHTDTLAFVGMLDERKRLMELIISEADSRRQAPEIGTQVSRIAIAELEKQLQAHLLEFEKSQIECKYYRNTIDRFLDAHPNFSNDIVDYLNMARSKDVLRRTVDILIEKRESARIGMIAEGGDIKILDHPMVPTSPVPDRKNMKMAASLLIALALGLGLAVGVDYFDNTVQNEQEITRRFNLPTFGAVPVLDARFIKGKHSDEGTDPNSNGRVNLTLLNNHKQSSPIAETYRSLRTAITFSYQDKNVKTITISSSVPSEGKSLTTYNLGVSYANSGKKTIIIDLDLRRASQHKLHGLERSPGFTDYFFDKCDFNSAIRKTPVENLYIMPAGEHINNPADLLSSNKMREFIEDIKTKFDYVLIDTPPISPCMDSRHIATLTDGMILVVRAEMTKLPILEHCIDLCNRVNVPINGVIVNHVSFRYNYGYYYVYQRYSAYGGYYYSGYQYYYSQDPDTGEKVKKKHRVKRSPKKKETLHT